MFDIVVIEIRPDQAPWDTMGPPGAPGSLEGICNPSKPYQSPW